MIPAQRLRLIFELQKVQKELGEGIRRAAERADNYIAVNPAGNRYVIESANLVGTISLANERIDGIIKQLKSKSPGADDTEAKS